MLLDVENLRNKDINGKVFHVAAHNADRTEITVYEAMKDIYSRNSILHCAYKSRLDAQLTIYSIEKKGHEMKTQMKFILHSV